MVESARNTSTTKPNIYLAIAEANDLFSYKYINEINCSMVNDFVPVKDWTTVYSWNYLAQQAMLNPDNNLFMLGADDMVFATPGWDTALIEHYEALKEKVHVYALRDSRDGMGTPHPIISREYIEALGYFAPPIFLHWYVDTWSVAISKSNGVFTHLQDYLLIHDKPSDTGAGDETHNRIRRAGWHERDTYVNDTCQHFLEAEKLRLDNYLRQREVA